MKKLLLMLCLMSVPAFAMSSTEDDDLDPAAPKAHVGTVEKTAEAVGGTVAAVSREYKKGEKKTKKAYKDAKKGYKKGLKKGKKKKKKGKKEE